MADINNLELKPPDPIDWDDTGSKGGSFKLVPKGEYTLVAREMPEKGATREGYLQFKFKTLYIVAPGTPYDSQEVRYTNVNTKNWPNRKGSSFSDFLLAAGIAFRPTTNEEYEAAIAATLNVPFRARLDWEAVCKEGNYHYRLKGMENFPTDAEGAKISSFNCPECAKIGREVRLFGNAIVKSFLAA